MTTNYIDFKGKKYVLNEPTVSNWAEIMKMKDLLTEQEMYVKMISKVSGIDEKEILETDATTIAHIGSIIQSYLNDEDQEYYPYITHKGVEYQIVDIEKITFGQFVDIDTFLGKDENYRISNLSELAAYLYVEKNTEYSPSNFKKRIESFKDLPLKYVEGSVFFLINLEKVLQELTPVYLNNKIMWQMMRLKIVLSSFGAGIRAYLSLPKTKFGKLTALLTLVLLPVLTIFLTLTTLIKKGISKLKK